MCDFSSKILYWKDVSCIFCILLGLQLCFNRTENTEILTSIRDQFDELYQAVETWNLGNEEVNFIFAISFFIPGVCRKEGQKLARGWHGWLMVIILRSLNADLLPSKTGVCDTARSRNL
jgi:hypothetical protein